MVLFLSIEKEAIGMLCWMTACPATFERADYTCFTYKYSISVCSQKPIFAMIIITVVSLKKQTFT
jgi:hypothetical protein